MNLESVSYGTATLVNTIVVSGVGNFTYDGAWRFVLKPKTIFGTQLYMGGSGNAVGSGYGRLPNIYPGHRHTHDPIIIDWIGILHLTSPHWLCGCGG